MHKVDIINYESKHIQCIIYTLKSSMGFGCMKFKIARSSGSSPYSYSPKSHSSLLIYWSFKATKLGITKMEDRRW